MCRFYQCIINKPKYYTLDLKDWIKKCRYQVWMVSQCDDLNFMAVFLPDVLQQQKHP